MSLNSLRQIISQEVKKMEQLEVTVKRGMAAVLAPADAASGIEVMLDEMAAFL